MQIKTFRAKSLHDALAIVRQELGPDASVLHTREVQAKRLFGLLKGPAQIEVTASADVNVPSRLPERTPSSVSAGDAQRANAAGAATAPAAASPATMSVTAAPPTAPTPERPAMPSAPIAHAPVTAAPIAPEQEQHQEAVAIDWRNGGRPTAHEAYGQNSRPSATSGTAPVAHAPHEPAPAPALPTLNEALAATNPKLQQEVQQEVQQFNSEIQTQLDGLHAMLDDLYRRSRSQDATSLPDTLFHAFTELIEADFEEEVARGLVEEVRRDALEGELDDPALVRSRIARVVRSHIAVGGEINVQPGKQRVVALVGPTGVGKTTTIAKLAANYRLKQKRRVGLVTVDTYRIAAVEQLRTYADIIDLPMEVVSTPNEMRDAVARLSDQELILIDTAGRSPRDEIRIRELKAMLAEAGTDEVHLVLSAVTGAKTLRETTERFAVAGTDSVVITKLDEASALGHLYPVLRDAGLSLRYWTTGQNVPDDIETADAEHASRLLLGTETVHGFDRR